MSRLPPAEKTAATVPYHHRHLVYSLADERALQPTKWLDGSTATLGLAAAAHLSVLVFARKSNVMLQHQLNPRAQRASANLGGFVGCYAGKHKGTSKTTGRRMNDAGRSVRLARGWSQRRVAVARPSAATALGRDLGLLRVIVQRKMLRCQRLEHRRLRENSERASALPHEKGRKGLTNHLLVQRCVRTRRRGNARLFQRAGVLPFCGMHAAR